MVEKKISKSAQKKLKDLYEDKLAPSLDTFWIMVKKKFKDDDDFEDVTKKMVKSWVDGQTTQQEFKRYYIKRKDFYPIYSSEKDFYQADTTMMPKFLTKNNKGYSAILTLINVNTRYLFAKAIKYGADSHSQEMVKFITEVQKKLKKMGKREIKMIQTDRGSEFKNKAFQKKFGKIHSYAHPEGKSEKYDNNKLSIIERVHQTMKRLMWKGMDMRDDDGEGRRWYDRLAKVVSTYNDRPHKSLRFRIKNSQNYEYLSPNEMDDEHEDLLIIHKQKETRKRNMKDTFKYGDEVRIPKAQTTTENKRGKYNRQHGIVWTKEIYTIVDEYNEKSKHCGKKKDKSKDSKFCRDRPLSYIVEDSNGKRIPKRFKWYNLQKVQKGSRAKQNIERKERKIQGRRKRNTDKDTDSIVRQGRRDENTRQEKKQLADRNKQGRKGLALGVVEGKRKRKPNSKFKD